MKTNKRRRNNLYDRRSSRLPMENQTFLNNLSRLYNINEENLKELNCDTFNNSTDEFKKKYKKAFIESSKSGLYEYYAKEVECLDEAIQKNNSSLEAADQNSTGYDRKINQSYIFSNKKKYRRVRQLCTILASEFCAIKNDKSNIVEPLKNISYKELGPRRRLKLMIRGYTYDGAQWNYTDELKKKFIKASEICYNNKHCLDSASSVEDIPKDFRGFLGDISAVVENPFNYLLDNINELTDLRNTEKVKERIKRKDNLTKKINQINQFEKTNPRGRLKRMVTKSKAGMKNEITKINEKLTKTKKMKELDKKKDKIKQYNK